MGNNGHLLNERPKKRKSSQIDILNGMKTTFEIQSVTMNNTGQYVVKGRRENGECAQITVQDGLKENILKRRIAEIFAARKAAAAICANGTATNGANGHTVEASQNGQPIRITGVAHAAVEFSAEKPCTAVAGSAVCADVRPRKVPSHKLAIRETAVASFRSAGGRWNLLVTPERVCRTNHIVKTVRQCDLACKLSRVDYA